jgi:hypothetical protein
MLYMIVCARYPSNPERSGMAAWSNDRERREVHKGWQVSVNYAITLLFAAFLVWIWGH